ncbi:MAG: XrtA-associated ATPase [Pseudomonadaceae bacterium]|nr:XrtA-associated ATPase [Pseudomonadaceae bacterium]
MYEEHFGLTGKPFQLSPDARFFFPSNEHRRALSFLQYGIEQADGFIVITGDVGTGKTTLVQALLNDIDQSSALVSNIVTSQLAEDDLLQLVAMNLGLRVNNNSKALLLKDLERLFIQRSREGRRVLLIVDEAQNLPAKSVEELRMLTNMQFEGRPLLQVFLLGQEEFRGTLLSEGFEQLRQRVIATYHLNPLKEDETRTYILHRLQTVGWNRRPDFEDDAFPAIFEFTDGVPRRINNLCDRLMLFAFLEEITTIDREVVTKVSSEIGTEFWGGATPPQPSSAVEAGMPEEGVNSQQVFNTPGQPLETMARIMFDKANVQQRLAGLERAIDGLGHSVKEELSFIRLMLEDLLHETRHSSHSSMPSASNKSSDKSSDGDADDSNAGAAADVDKKRA